MISTGKYYFKIGNLVLAIFLSSGITSFVFSIIIYAMLVVILYAPLGIINELFFNFNDDLYFQIIMVLTGIITFGTYLRILLFYFICNIQYFYAMPQKVDYDEAYFKDSFAVDEDEAEIEKILNS